MPVSVSLTCLHCAHTCLHCAHTWTVTAAWLRSAYLTWLHCAYTWTVTAAWLRRSESGVQWWCAELWETEYNDTAINYSWLWKYIMTLKRKLKTVNKFVSKTRTRHTGAAVKTTNNAPPPFQGRMISIYITVHIVFGTWSNSVRVYFGTSNFGIFFLTMYFHDDVNKVR